MLVMYETPSYCNTLSIMRSMMEVDTSIIDLTSYVLCSVSGLAEFKHSRKCIASSSQQILVAFSIPAPLDCVQAVAERDVAYENIMQKPVQELQVLATCLGIADQVNVNFTLFAHPAQLLLCTALSTPRVPQCITSPSAVQAA